ncbi:methylated-DNA--[protein]-cysteine S-methyltransferase [Carnobacterium maltaromaticum]|uniref:methylated-DNA--[protein]-cysteine S-methyltransferase n=1 Tax=Carnobacterium maltaromaticum TaxID=2751 RepID=UPI0039BE7308
MLINSPIGFLHILEDQQGITNIIFVNEEEDLTIKKVTTGPFGKQLALELERYFSGELKKFTVPLSLQVGTTFQQHVWQALQNVPYGSTQSYADIAVAIENPKAVRAIGQANRNNPLPIVIPCHRIIGKNGSMTGYSGASEIGIAKKRYLLALEKNNCVSAR